LATRIATIPLGAGESRLQPLRELGVSITLDQPADTPSGQGDLEASDYLLHIDFEAGPSRESQTDTRGPPLSSGLNTVDPFEDRLILGAAAVCGIASNLMFNRSPDAVQA